MLAWLMIWPILAVLFASLNWAAKLGMLFAACSMEEQSASLAGHHSHVRRRYLTVLKATDRVTRPDLTRGTSLGGLVADFTNLGTCLGGLVADITNLGRRKSRA